MTELHTAMILSAGTGRRMLPLTETRPKPLIELQGRTLVDHALDRLAAGGIKRVIINLHHFADMMRAHLSKRSDVEILFSDETDLLLDSGGGVKKALPLFGGQSPLLLANADMIWLDETGPSLIERMAQAWAPAQMDVLNGLCEVSKVTGYDGGGDFFLTDENHIRLREDAPSAPYMFMGLELINPTLFDSETETIFTRKNQWAIARAQGRQHGLVHTGRCLHVGSLKGLDQATQALLHSG